MPVQNLNGFFPFLHGSVQTCLYQIKILPVRMLGYQFVINRTSLVYHGLFLQNICQQQLIPNIIGFQLNRFSHQLQRQCQIVSQSQYTCQLITDRRAPLVKLHALVKVSYRRFQIAQNLATHSLHKNIIELSLLVFSQNMLRLLFICERIESK